MLPRGNQTREGSRLVVARQPCNTSRAWRPWGNQKARGVALGGFGDPKCDKICMMAACPPNASPLALGGVVATKCEKGRTWCLHGRQMRPLSHLAAPRPPSARGVAFSGPAATRVAFDCHHQIRPHSHLVVPGQPCARRLAFCGPALSNFYLWATRCESVRVGSQVVQGRQMRPLSHLVAPKQMSAMGAAFSGLAKTG